VLKDGRFVRAGGLNQVNIVEGVANTRYWLRSSETGKGIMRIAARRAIVWAFENRELSRIEIVAAIGNDRIQRVSEKIRSCKDAVLAKRIIIGGEPCSAVLYSFIGDWLVAPGLLRPSVSSSTMSPLEVQWPVTQYTTR
jgi:ribosomal-protein-serine acetyltransferase